MIWEYVVCAIAGGAISFQNVQAAKLGERSSFVFANLLVYILGSLISLVVWLALREQVVSVSSIPWWCWLSGPTIVYFVLTISVTCSRLGVSLATALMLTAQITSSVILDSFGWLGFLLKPASALRITGLCLSILSIFMISYTPRRNLADHLSNTVKLSRQEQLILIFLAITSGISLAIFGAMVGLFGSLTTASFSSFIASIMAAVILSFMWGYERLVLKSKYTVIDTWRNAEWYLKFIGVFGAFYSLILAYVLPTLGAATFFALANACQILTALACDRFIFKQKIGALKIAGVAILIVGAVLVSIY